MAQSKDVRPKITLQSTAGTGYRYVTTKNRRNTRLSFSLSSAPPMGTIQPRCSPSTTLLGHMESKAPLLGGTAR